jgi:hypothetical protein
MANLSYRRIYPLIAAFASMKRFFLFLLILPALFSCNKENSNQPPVPPGDTTSFSIPVTGEIVMYEVNIRALSITSDLPGVIGRLDEIKDLGINVIWLMPIHPIGEVNSVNSPYCVKNYKEVNPEFGTLADLQNLVKEAHKQGIAVVIDWVANHTSWDNPWIVNKDWYTQDGSGNIIHPEGTNWMDVADLNYSSEEMRLAMIDAMKYWVNTADVDGFRCDAADMIPYDFWLQAIPAVSALKDSLIWLAEGARFDHFAAGFQMNYSWSFYDKLVSVYSSNQPATGLVSMHNIEYLSLPEGKEKLRFSTNHDKSAWEATPMVLFNGEHGALAASVATICLGGVPLIYGSQEVGVTENVPFFTNDPIDWSLHPEMLKAYQDIFKFYNSSVPLKYGVLASYSTADVLAFVRSLEQGEVFVIVNMRNLSLSYDIPAAFEGTTWKDAFDGSEIVFPPVMDLQAYNYRILKR